jgi:FMN phosphatase YigB (HAD superfamily)
MIFDPQSPLSIQQLVPFASELIQNCKDKGFKVYVLSNWDKESFLHFQEKHREFFDLFDGIVISGEAESAKPHADIYTYFLKKFDLDAQLCLFIDDQQINLDAAKKHGIPGILCTKVKRIFYKYPDLPLVWKKILKYEQSLYGSKINHSCDSVEKQSDPSTC